MPAAARSAAGVSPHPGGRVRVLRRAGHFVHLERPGEVAGEVLAFPR